MLLNSESPKYLGNEEGLLNVELMRKLYHVIAFNLAKSVVKMAGKNQVIVKGNHGHKTKVHRRDLKVIDSDAKVAEMYQELRKDGKRDAQHCMPIKQIPDLQWEKEEQGPNETEKPLQKSEEKKVGPTLRSSRNKQQINEVQEQEEKTPPGPKNTIVKISLQWHPQ